MARSVVRRGVGAAQKEAASRLFGSRTIPSAASAAQECVGQTSRADPIARRRGGPAGSVLMYAEDRWAPGNAASGARSSLTDTLLGGGGVFRARQRDDFRDRCLTIPEGRREAHHHRRLHECPPLVTLFTKRLALAPELLRDAEVAGATG